MALTLTPLLNQEPFGAHKSRLCTAQFDNSYPTGGLDVTAEARNKCGIGNVLAVAVLDGCASTGHLIRYDEAAKKLMAWQGDNPNAAAAPAVQVPNATNISTATVKVIVIGD